MIKKTLYNVFIIFICHALAYSPLINAAQLSLPTGDLIAPEIIQPEYVGTVAKGDSHIVSVRVTDNVAVKQVLIYYRAIGTESYRRLLMQNKKNTDYYVATISADKIKPPGIEYYIQAADNAGNTLLHGYSFSPLSVKTLDGAAQSVVAENTGAPAEEDSIFSNKWFWIGVGVLALGAAAASGSDSGGSTPTATVTVTTAEPVN
ncbi:hypothetical protein MNBD_GAMMA09-3108 [hydrothermal vent metagenome]|uniref:Uncharacterized protein n=1 Tax=hydrothermal vent metagenome TaxID=652676 RepID=A0A3B0XUL8_9ZZZZ